MRTFSVAASIAVWASICVACGGDDGSETDAATPTDGGMGRTDGETPADGGVDAGVDAGTDGGTTGGEGVLLAREEDRGQVRSATIALAPDGTPHVFFSVPGGTGAIIHATPDASGSFTMDEIFPVAGEALAAAVDSEGVPHLLFDDRELVYATRGATGWTRIAVRPNWRGYPSIAIGPGDSVHIAFWLTESNGIGHGVFDGTAFTTTEITGSFADTGDRTASDIAVASDGTVHILFWATFAGEPRLSHAFGTTGSFTLERVTGISGLGRPISMALDATGEPQAATVGGTEAEPQDLLYLRHTAAGWTESKVAMAASPYTVSFALDATGSPYFGFSFGNRTLLIRRAGAMYEPIDLAELAYGYQTDMALEPDGTAHFVFTQLERVDEPSPGVFQRLRYGRIDPGATVISP